jgi:hypothetical protein
MAQNNSADPTPRETITDGFTDQTVPLTAYSKRGGPRGGPGKGEPTGPPPGVRTSTLANPEPFSGAALSIKTIGGDRARTLRDYETNAPRPYDVHDDRKSVGIVQPYAGGVSPLWSKRARQAQQGS